ncbi:MAG: PD-(D/E)XK nuclease family protein [Thermoplasmata archaeon]|nr:PD-(D/E)XK nuclease family protein [Thermoplasmata archaeon]
MIYSYSAISTFENCPFKFKLAYMDKIKPLRKNIESFMGSRVHEALEKLYRDKLFAKIDSLEELISFYNERWEKEMHGNIFVVKGYEIENYRKMGEMYIRDYYNTYKPFDDGRIIALEKRIFFPLNEKYWINGIIDRISEKDGVYEVHDYKTSLYFPSLNELDETQLAIYAIALQNLYGAEEIELVWHYLAFNKEIRVRKKSYEYIREEIINKIEEIENAKKNGKFPAKESALCDYCEYQPICPLFKHHYKINEMHVEEVAEEDGFNLVNKYWEIERKIDELEAIKEEIKKKLIDYARKNEVEHIYGSDKMVKVKFYKNFYFRDGEIVKKLLKKEGLYERFSRLDFVALSKALESDVIPSYIKEKLKEIMEEREIIRIYLRDLKREE